MNVNGKALLSPFLLAGTLLVGSTILAPSTTFADQTDEAHEETADIVEEVETIDSEEVIEEGTESTEEENGVEKEEEQRRIYFSDVKEGSFAFEAIQYLAEREIISGRSDGTFRPNESITRAQAAKMLALELNLKAPRNYKIKATDVPKSHWAYEYFVILEANGIMTGQRGKLLPSENITRAQMAAMLNRAYNYAPPTRRAAFRDVNSSFWAYQYINTMVANGITDTEGKAFRPNVPIKRAEFALYLARTMDDRYKNYPFD